MDFEKVLPCILKGLKFVRLSGKESCSSRKKTYVWELHDSSSFAIFYKKMYIF